MGVFKKSSLKYYIHEAGANLHWALHCPFRVEETYGPSPPFPQHTCRLQKAQQQRENIHLQPYWISPDQRMQRKK